MISLNRQFDTVRLHIDCIQFGYNFEYIKIDCIKVKRVNQNGIPNGLTLTYHRMLNLEGIFEHKIMTQ